MLPPKEAADLALALHELATNAIKHGAWSVPAGQVALRWEAVTTSQGRMLRATWKESGGPPVQGPPERRGFGTSLLHGLFTGEDGVSVEFEPDGLRCTIAVAMGAGVPELAATEPVKADPAPEKEEASVAGLRVLVVEDEAVVRLDLVEILREAGAVVVAEAGSVTDGLEKAEDIELDVAVLDRNLNGESSQPLARALARRGIPTVFVSGYRTPIPGEVETEGKQISLQKPISPEALVTALAVVKNR
jgi:CheY-like chemotaxis protein